MPHDHHHGDAWDDAYRGGERMWSGEPNTALVAEIADDEPGRALDVGCGEGADAIWLAQRGWEVTALDPSAVALERARAEAADAGVAIEWVHAGLVEAEFPAHTFDLVSAFYPALPKRADGGTEQALLRAVAPGGTLLVVYHADMDAERAKAHGFDPADYVGIADVRAALDPDWEIAVDEQRERRVTEGRGAEHRLDQILRVRGPR